MNGLTGSLGLLAVSHTMAGSSSLLGLLEDGGIVIILYCFNLSLEDDDA